MQCCAMLCYDAMQDMVFFRANKGHLLQQLLMMPKFEVAVKILENLQASKHSTARHSTAQHSAAQHSAAQRSAA